jgi:hypothetical protein
MGKESAVAFALAFLVVIPEGNLLFPSLPPDHPTTQPKTHLTIPKQRRPIKSE